MPDALTLTSQPGSTAGESPAVLVLVQVTAKPPDQARVLGELIAATRRWAGEPGCSHATAWRHPADVTRFLILEGFVSPDAFQAHQATPSARDFVRRVQQHLAAPPTRTIWHPIHAAASSEEPR